MRLLHLQCRACGAPMEVKASRIDVACEFCGSTALVREDEPVPTAPPPVDRIDAEWREERRRFDRPTPGREVRIDDEAVTWVAAGLAAFTFFGALVMLAKNQYPIAALLGALTLGLCVAAGFRQKRWNEYRSAREQFVQRRRAASKVSSAKNAAEDDG